MTYKENIMSPEEIRHRSRVLFESAFPTEKSKLFPNIEQGQINQLRQALDMQYTMPIGATTQTDVQDTHGYFQLLFGYFNYQHGQCSHNKKGDEISNYLCIRIKKHLKYLSTLKDPASINKGIDAFSLLRSTQEQYKQLKAKSPGPPPQLKRKKSMLDNEVAMQRLKTQLDEQKRMLHFLQQGMIHSTSTEHSQQASSHASTSFAQSHYQLHTSIPNAQTIGKHNPDHPAAFLLSRCMNVTVSPKQTIIMTPDLRQPEKKLTRTLAKSTCIEADGKETILEDLIKTTVSWQNKPLTEYGFSILMLLVARYSENEPYAQIFQSFLHAYTRHPNHQSLSTRMTDGIFKNACALDLAHYYQNHAMKGWLIQQGARIDCNTLIWIAHSPVLNDEETLQQMIDLVHANNIRFFDADNAAMHTCLCLGVHYKPLSYAFIAILQKNVAYLNHILLTYNSIPSLLSALEKQDTVKQLVVKKLVECYILQGIDLDSLARACVLTTMQSPSKDASLQTLIAHSHLKQAERKKVLSPQTLSIIGAIKDTLCEVFLQFKERHPEKYQQFLKELDLQQITHARLHQTSPSNSNPTLVYLSHGQLQTLKLPLWLRQLSAYDVFDIFGQPRPCVTCELDEDIVYKHAPQPSSKTSHPQPIELDSEDDTPANCDAQSQDNAVMTNDQSVSSSPPHDTRYQTEQQTTHGLDAMSLWYECMQTGNPDDAAMPNAMTSNP